MFSISLGNRSSSLYSLSLSLSLAPVTTTSLIHSQAAHDNVGHTGSPSTRKKQRLNEIWPSRPLSHIYRRRTHPVCISIEGWFLHTDCARLSRPVGRQCSDKFTTEAAATSLCLINGRRWREATASCGAIGWLIYQSTASNHSMKALRVARYDHIASCSAPPPPPPLTRDAPLCGCVLIQTLLQH